MHVAEAICTARDACSMAASNKTNRVAVIQAMPKRMTVWAQELCQYHNIRASWTFLSSRMSRLRLRFDADIVVTFDSLYAHPIFLTRSLYMNDEHIVATRKTLMCVSFQGVSYWCLNQILHDHVLVVDIAGKYLVGTETVLYAMSCVSDAQSRLHCYCSRNLEVSHQLMRPKMRMITI